MAILDALMLVYLQMYYVNAEGMPHGHMKLFLKKVRLFRNFRNIDKKFLMGKISCLNVDASADITQ